MNTVKFRSLFLISILLLSCSFVRGEEPERDKKKEISKTYAVNKNDLLHVDNRYGNITISHWKKNEVSINVVIEVTARNDNRIQEILDRINIDINKSGNTVSAITSLKNTNISGNNEKMTINYYISMPDYLETSLTLRYGNISMPNDNKGKTKIDLKYGNIKAGNFVSDLSLNASYSNLELGNLVNINMDLAYCGKVVFKNSNNARISSKYSNLEIADIGSLQLDKRYGNISAGQINNAALDMKYSNANIKFIKQELKATALDYGTIDVQELSPDFNSVQVNARYGNLNIKIAAKTSFEVEANNMKYGNLNIKGFKQQDMQKTSNSYHATINGGNNNRKVRFDGGNYSNLTINAL